MVAHASVIAHAVMAHTDPAKDAYRDLWDHTLPAKNEKQCALEQHRRADAFGM